MYAAKYNRLDLLKRLISEGADVNHSTFKGNALYYAHKYQRESIIEELEKHDAKIIKPGKQNNEIYTFNGIDGPYVLHDDESDISVVVSVNEKNQLKLSKEKMLDHVTVNIPGHNAFRVPLKKSKNEDKAILENASPIFAVSDIEGNYEAFTSLLKNNMVLDENLRWKFGKGHLVLNGDFVDRGEHVTQVLWLIYKLEQEAEKAGGRVHFILGNHEFMNLRGDTRYNRKKYKAMVQKLGLNGKGLFPKGSELGDWLRTKNVIEKIDGHLFVHGGISDSLLQKGLSLKEINQIARTNFDTPGKQMPEEARLLFGRFGVLWDRAMVIDYKYYEKISDHTLNQVLNFYNAKKIIVGHNVVSNVSTDYDGKVIRIDVNHRKKTPQGLLLKGNKYYRVYSNGNREVLR